MRVLITGAGGQVGHDLVEACSGRLPAAADPEFAAGKLPEGWEVRGLDRAALDVADPAAVSAAIADFQPGLIFHAAAYTAVDRAEAEPAQAAAVNLDGTANVARAAEQCGAHLVAISTDYVFDGFATTPYRELDPTSPLSVYGRTKLAGEQACPAAATIARTSWVVGLHGSNIVKTILRLADAGQHLTFVDDQFGSPTSSADLAVALVALGQARTPGIVHVTNSGTTSWFELARLVLETAGLSPDLVTPIATADRLPAPPATRPMYSVLDGTRLAELGIGPLPPWDLAFRRLVRMLRS